MTEWDKADEIELPYSTIHHDGLIRLIEEYLGPRKYYLRYKIGAEDWELCQSVQLRTVLRVKRGGKIDLSMLTFLKLKLK